MMVRWSGEVQVNVSGMSNLNLSCDVMNQLNRREGHPGGCLESSFVINN